MAVFDWFTRSPKPVTAPQSGEPMSVRLRSEFATHPSRGITPASLANILQQAEYGDLTRQAELFLDMEDNDAHLAAELMKRKMAVKQLDWTLSPVRDAAARERKASARLEDILRDELDLYSLRMDLLDAIGHGYSCVEMTWNRRANGLWLPKLLEHRSPTWFLCPPDQRDTLHLRDSTGNGQPLRPFGWIPHIHRARSGYLPRAGLHRVLSWTYLYKIWAGRDLAEYLDTFGTALRLGKFPSGTTQEAKAQLQSFVESVGHNAAGIIPDGMTVEIIQTINTGNVDGFKVMIDWCESSQSKAILGGTLTSQTAANGNRALGDVHNQVRQDIRDDDARQIDETLSAYLVYPIAVINGLCHQDRCPRFVSDTQEPEDLKLYADALPNLVHIGARIPQRWVNEKLKIPEPEGDEPVLSAGSAPTNGTAEGTPEAISARAALSVPIDDPDPTPVSAHTEQLAKAAGPSLDTLIAHLRQLTDQAESLDALRDALLAAYGDLDTQELTNVMAMAFATADLAGRFDAREER